MNYYNVPQDVEVADQVLGPLTLKQFGFMLAGIGFGFGFYTLFTAAKLPIFVGVLAAIFPVALFFSLAFVPYNSRPLDYYIFPLYQYYTGEKLRLWAKESLDAGGALDSLNKLTEKVTLKSKSDTGQPFDSGIENKKGVRQELSHIKKMAALLDGGIEEMTDDYISAEIALNETPSRNKEITQALNDAAENVAKNREPAISQVATVNPNKGQNSNLPDLSAYKFADLESPGGKK
ncbi:MAG: PrgI family protein [bacterium]